MTTLTSRRAILVGAAVLPALSIPVSAANDNADAELLALGEQYEKLAAMMEDAQRRSEPIWNLFQRRAAELPRPIGDKAFIAFSQQFSREHPIAWPECDDVSEMMDEPMRRIMELPATTLAGLKVKARLVQGECSELWDVKNDDDADWGPLVSRKLVEAVLAMTEKAVQS